MTTTTAPEDAGVETLTCTDLLLEVVIFAQVVMSVICRGWAMGSRCFMSKLIVMGTQLAEADTKGWEITGVAGMIMTTDTMTIVITGMVMDMDMIQGTIAVGAQEDTTMPTHREDVMMMTVMTTMCMIADMIKAGTMTGTMAGTTGMMDMDMEVDICLRLAAVTFAREATSNTYHGPEMMT